jgi:hypothetical protein
MNNQFPLFPQGIAEGVFYKVNPLAVAFTRTGNETATLNAGTIVEVVGQILRFPTAQNIVMPTLTAGTDYAIYACSDNTIRADASFSAPTGYTTLNSRQIGGFHFALGGNATGFNTGGDTTPQINPFSFWDLKFRPACPDPRGWAFVLPSLGWLGIYMMNNNPGLNGVSRAGLRIADGENSGGFPVIPAADGGDGTTTYGNLTWYTANSVLTALGCRLPTFEALMRGAWGAVEQVDRGTDPVNTILWAPGTSAIGLIGAAGYQWCWISNLSVDVSITSAANWAANTGGRGSTFQTRPIIAGRFGGTWNNASFSGSRCSNWNSPISDSGAIIGVRAACDHLMLG